MFSISSLINLRKINKDIRIKIVSMCFHSPCPILDPEAFGNTSHKLFICVIPPSSPELTTDAQEIFCYLEVTEKRVHKNKSQKRRNTSLSLPFTMVLVRLLSGRLHRHLQFWRVLVTNNSKSAIYCLLAYRINSTEELTCS